MNVNFLALRLAAGRMAPLLHGRQPLLPYSHVVLLRQHAAFVQVGSSGRFRGALQSSLDL